MHPTFWPAGRLAGSLLRRLVNALQRLLDRTDGRIDELPRHQPHATHPEHPPLEGTDPSSHEDTVLFAELLPEEGVVDTGGIIRQGVRDKIEDFIPRRKK